MNIDGPIMWHFEDVVAPRRFAKRSRPAPSPNELFSWDSTPSDQPIAIFSVGPWWVLIELGTVSGRMEAVRLEIRGYAGEDDQTAAPIDATALRQIPLGRLVNQARRALAEEATELAWRLIDRARDSESDQLPEGADSALGVADASETTGRRGGRPPLSDSDHRITAELYRAALGEEPRDRILPANDARRVLVSGSSHEPTAAVGRALGLTPSAAAKRVARARKAGHLSPTRQGIARA